MDITKGISVPVENQMDSRAVRYDPNYEHPHMSGERTIPSGPTSGYQPLKPCGDDD